MRRGADDAEKKDAQPSKWALSTGRMPREATRDPQTQLREEAAAGALAARREEIREGLGLITFSTPASVLPLPRLAGARVRGGERACRALRVPTRGREPAADAAERRPFLVT